MMKFKTKINLKNKSSQLRLTHETWVIRPGNSKSKQIIKFNLQSPSMLKGVIKTKSIKKGYKKPSKSTDQTRYLDY
jgi:hypothetical protein